ncbi:MAG TPA: DUF6624 domain-containing protein [Thermoanaerobaculia bacterium]
MLQIQKEKEVQKLRRHSDVPPDLTLSPIKLGHGAELPVKRVLEVQQELAARLKEDQAVRKDPSRRGEMGRVNAENGRFLRTLVEEVGWIDSRRFGRQTSADAVILLQHTMDIPLVSAVLPMIEQDFKAAGPGAELFAIVFDGLRIDLGQKQRFGTQVGEDLKGEPLVLPLESIEQVEAYRKELGLPPLKDYLAKASQVLYDGKPIRMPQPDE